MTGQGAYGTTLADAMSVPTAATFVSQTSLRGSTIGVTEIRSDAMEERETAPIEPDDAFLVMVQMRDWPRRVLYEDGKALDAKPLSNGAVTLFDLRKVWTGVRFTPIHYVCFYVPKPALERVAEVEGVRFGDALPNDYCGGNDDPTIAGLTRTLLPAFARPEEANHLFVDHIAAATVAHVLRRYGGLAVERDQPKAALAASGRQRAEELIDSQLDGDVSIMALANECGMAATEFVAAFRQSTGLAPHRWLLRRRVERAMELIKSSHLSIEEVAKVVGFANAAHLTRVFREFVSLTPAAWRKLVRH